MSTHHADPASKQQMDGGLLCWLQVIGVFAAWTNTWGLVNAFGEFQTYYESQLPQSQDQIAWIGSLQSFLLLFFGMLTGPLFDRGHFRTLIYLGNFLVVFGMMMTRYMIPPIPFVGIGLTQDSICKAYWQILLCQGVIVGIGFGCIYVPSVAILPQYFEKKRQWANGVAAVGSGFGGVIYPIVLRRLSTSIGFAWAVRVLGFLSLFFAAVIILTLRNRLPPGKMRQIVPPGFFQDIPMVVYTIGLFFILIVLYVPVVYISSYSLQFRLTSPNLAFCLVPIVQAANIGGRLLAFVADWTGPLNLTIPALMGASALAFSWIAVHSGGSLIAFAILYGICFGTVQGLGPGCVISLTTDRETLGSRIGFSFGLASFGVLIGTPVAGTMLNDGSDYLSVQVFTGTLSLAAAALYIVSRTMRSGIGLAKI